VGITTRSLGRDTQKINHQYQCLWEQGRGTSISMGMGIIVTNGNASSPQRGGKKFESDTDEQLF